MGSLNSSVDAQFYRGVKNNYEKTEVCVKQELSFWRTLPSSPVIISFICKGKSFIKILFFELYVDQCPDSFRKCSNLETYKNRATKSNDKFPKNLTFVKMD